MMNRKHSRAGQVLSLVILLVVAARQAPAADFSCRAVVDKTTISPGQSLALTVTAEGGISWSADFQIPDIPGVQFFGGGTQQSVSYTNGQTMTTVSRSYYLQVDTDQDFVIGPVVVTSDGGSCSTEPINIKVVQGQAAPDAAIPPADTGNRVVAPGTSSGRTDLPSGEAGDDIFITLEADAQEVWLGQQVVLSFKYYRRIQPWNNPQFTAPRTEGFWREDLGQERRYRAVIQGRSYTVTEIRYALFPTRSGELTIEPAELAFPDQGLERFFSSRRRRGPRTLRTEPVTITVKSLPADQPENFSGLVATRVGLESALDSEKVPRGEPVSWKVQLVSDGFLKGFGALSIPELEGARSHDAGESFATQVENGRLVSAVTLEKVIVPAEEGRLDIPPVELSWFDASSGGYRTARSSPRVLLVDPSDLPYLTDEDSGFLRNEVARLAQDLAFIHNVPGRLGTGSWQPLSSALWWTLFLLPLVLLAGWKLYLRRLSALNRDPVARRRRRALERARQQLGQAAEREDLASQLAALNRAVAGFVADCLDVPAGAVGPAEVEEFGRRLEQDAVGARLRSIMELSETARFGGMASGQSGQPASPRELALEIDDLLSRLFKGVAMSGTGTSGLQLGIFLASLVVLTGATLTTAQTALAAVDPLRLMAEANQAYTAGDLDRSLELYRQVEAMDVEDPVLFFNLGNTYARRGDLGRAVASYLRAERLDPRDDDIKANLNWVRSHITDLELSEADLPLFIAQFVWLARFLTVGEWAILVVILTWLVAGLIAFAWYRGSFSDGLRRAALVSGAVLAGTMAVFIWRWHGQEIQEQAVVVAPEAAVLSGPAESFPVQFQVHDGLTVFLEGSQQGWSRISLGGESLGWLPSSALEAVNPRHQPDPGDLPENPEEPENQGR